MQKPNHSQLAIEAAPTRLAIGPGVAGPEGHGKNHYPITTPAEAAEINEHYGGITIVYGAHGRGRESLPSPMPAEGYAVLPTDKEYQAVMETMAMLNGDDFVPGDTLLIENAGWQAQPARSMPRYKIQAEFQDDSELRRLRNGVATLGELMFSVVSIQSSKIMLDIMMISKALEAFAHMQRAESIRRDQLADAWTYAAHIALSKGVNLVFADFTEQQMQEVKRRTGKELTELLNSTDSQERAMGDYYQGQRNVAAQRIGVDYAMANRDSAKQVTEKTGRKPNLFMFYGGDETHRGIARGFESDGVKVKVIDLAYSTQQERIAENIYRELQRAWGVATAASGQQAPEQTSTTRPRWPLRPLRGVLGGPLPRPNAKREKQLVSL